MPALVRDVTIAGKRATNAIGEGLWNRSTLADEDGCLDWTRRLVESRRSVNEPEGTDRDRAIRNQPRAFSSSSGRRAGMSAVPDPIHVKEDAAMHNASSGAWTPHRMVPGHVTGKGLGPVDSAPDMSYDDRRG